MSIPPATPSASVLILRDVDGPPEVLLVRRNTKIAFHGGSWVFPGGKVDAADVTPEVANDELEVARRAAIREVYEEAGIIVGGSSLRAVSHWTTPENQPKRFATWFFGTVVAAHSVVKIDGNEIVDYRWLGVDDALALHAQNEIALPPPTFVSLVKLHRFSASATFFEHVEERGVERFVPRVVDLKVGRCSLYEEDAGYNSLDLAAPGARHRLMMVDSAWEYLQQY